MRAAVLFEQGKPQRVEELDLESPRRGEVLVRMAASGVCHSCLHAADGSWKGVPVPIVLGDEGAGVVEALGPDVTELAVGDHVILSWAPTCGRCHYCVIGRPNLCERRQPGRGVLPDGTTRMSLGGAPVYHYGHVATYASRTVVHESCAIRIDPAMPLDRAALIGCSVMTGVGAVLNTAAVPAGASVAVFGVGGVGLAGLMAGKIAGCDPIIAVDRLPSRLALARELGATHVLESRGAETLENLRRITGGGAHFAQETSAVPEVFRLAVDGLRPLGTCVLVGSARAGTEVSFEMPVLQGGRTVRGVIQGDSRPREFIPLLVDLFIEGRFPLDRLVTEYRFADINRAAGEATSGATIKPVLRLPH